MTDESAQPAGAKAGGQARLAGAWLRLAAAAGLHGDPADLGARLLDAYAEPHRRYHDQRHLAEVLAHVDDLAGHADDPTAVRLAAWFHDVVYDPARADNEERSASLAEHELAAAGAVTALVSRVADLVRLTASHDPALDDRDGAVLCDADLAVLARDPVGYRAYVDDVRAEYAHVPDPDWRVGRAAVLATLLDRPALFRTPTGDRLWADAARRNATAELTVLATG